MFSLAQIANINRAVRENLSFASFAKFITFMLQKEKGNFKK